MSELTHLDTNNRPQMVDVGEKKITKRLAIAKGMIAISGSTYELMSDNQIKKGDVLYSAQLAGIMAAKKTSDIIPMCHPIALDSVEMDFSWNRIENGTEELPYAMVLDIYVAVSTEAKTGVEMEAIVAAEIAAVTVYDMCKSVDKNMMLLGTQLLYKSGGRSGELAIDGVAQAGKTPREIIDYFMQAEPDSDGSTGLNETGGGIVE